MKMKRMTRMIAGILAFALLISVIPAQTVSAKPAKMSAKDFSYKSGGETYYLDDTGDEDGTLRLMYDKKFKTYRGIKVGSWWNTVKKKYGNTSKKKLGSDKFTKYIKVYKDYYGYTDLSTSKWKYYADYKYKSSWGSDQRLRFYMDKNNKVVCIAYIEDIKFFKLSSKKMYVGFKFKAPKGKKITTKKIKGKTVQILPKNSTISVNKKKTGDFGTMAVIYQIDSKGKTYSMTSYPLNLSGDYTQYKTGTKVSTLMKDGMFSPKLKKSYSYYKLVIYDIDASGGFKIPTTYYFKI